MTETEEISIYEKPFLQSDKTDAIFMVEGKKLHVNKALFCFHSDYFNDLFNSHLPHKPYPLIRFPKVEFVNFAIVMSQVTEEPLSPEGRRIERLLLIARVFSLRAATHQLELRIIASNESKTSKISLSDDFPMSNLMDHAISKMSHPEEFLRIIGCDKFTDRTKAKIIDRQAQVYRMNNQKNRIYDMMSKDRESIGLAKIYEKKVEKSKRMNAVLVVGKERLRVNKEVLSYHSDYFKELFKWGSEIPIFSVEPDEMSVFEAMIGMVHDQSYTFCNRVDFRMSLDKLADDFDLPAVKKHAKLIEEACNK